MWYPLLEIKNDQSKALKTWAARALCVHHAPPRSVMRSLQGSEATGVLAVARPQASACSAFKPSTREAKGRSPGGSKQWEPSAA